MFVYCIKHTSLWLITVHLFTKQIFSTALVWNKIKSIIVKDLSLCLAEDQIAHNGFTVKKLFVKVWKSMKSQQRIILSHKGRYTFLYDKAFCISHWPFREKRSVFHDDQLNQVYFSKRLNKAGLNKSYVSTNLPWKPPD